MADSVFKTPYNTDTPKSVKNDRLFTPLKYRSDSDESIASSASEGASNGSDNQLSIIAEYDEIPRYLRSLKSQYTHTEQSFIDLIESSKIILQSFQKSRVECLRLQQRLDGMVENHNDLEEKLVMARKLLDKEKKNVRAAERERDQLAMQITQVKEMFIREKDVRKILPEDTLSKFAFLDGDRIDQEQAPYLSCIPEVNSTGSILSDFSLSRSEDGLDTSKYCSGKTWKKHRHSAGGVPEQPAVKKRRSSGNRIVEISTSDTVRATTTLSMPKNGPITATSVIEAVPYQPSAPPAPNYTPSAPPPDTPQSIKSVESYNPISHETTIPADMIFQSWAKKEGPPKPTRANLGKPDVRERKETNNNYPQKGHAFQKKTVVIPDNCGICQKKLRFGRLAWKCKDCKNLCHEECKDNLPTPCIPVIHTPNQKNGLGVVADYTGTTPPMVPALIIHCVNEIEMREAKEVGLYRVPGSEKDVKSLKERFLRGKAAPCLNEVEIHVLCGVVKDFLRSLQEPLITKASRSEFVLAAECNDKNLLSEKMSELPQPNRDTLAYMLLHLQRISEKKEIKMSVDNLARVFGPTIVGYSSDDIEKEDLLNETKQQINVMRYLISLPMSFWEAYINLNPSHGGSRLQQTPSTDSLLLRPTRTPNRGYPNAKKRFFPTPPDNRY